LKFIHELRNLPSQPFNKSKILKPKLLNEATPTGLTNTLSGKTRGIVHLNIEKRLRMRPLEIVESSCNDFKPL